MRVADRMLPVPPHRSDSLPDQRRSACGSKGRSRCRAKGDAGPGRRRLPAASFANRQVHDLRRPALRLPDSFLCSGGRHGPAAAGDRSHPPVGNRGRRPGRNRSAGASRSRERRSRRNEVSGGAGRTENIRPHGAPLQLLVLAMVAKLFRAPGQHPLAVEQRVREVTGHQLEQPVWHGQPSLAVKPAGQRVRQIHVAHGRR